MELTIEQILEGALKLPPDARVLLADKLVESLDPADEEAIRKAWSEEAHRRLEEIESGRVETIPGDEALARVRRALGR